jgi:hypothetical protein
LTEYEKCIIIEKKEEDILTLYEMNKASYAKLPDISEEDKKFALTTIKTFINASWNHYYMILNHDIHYYTVYNWNQKSSELFAIDVFDLMSRLGKLKAVELSESNDMVEFWIVDITGECHMYAFFAYDKGVIEI